MATARIEPPGGPVLKVTMKIYPTTEMGTALKTDKGDDGQPFRLFQGRVFWGFRIIGEDAETGDPVFNHASGGYKSAPAASQKAREMAEERAELYRTFKNNGGMTTEWTL
jgi:hypothetical protein